MDTKEDCERDSCGDGNGNGNGDFIDDDDEYLSSPPPRQAATSSSTTSNHELGVPPSSPPGTAPTTKTIQPLASNHERGVVNDLALNATRDDDSAREMGNAPPPSTAEPSSFPRDDDITICQSSSSSSSPLVSSGGGSHVEEQDRPSEDCRVPPTYSAEESAPFPTFSPMEDEENENGDVNKAPVPPETIAASFGNEAAMLELIDDDFDEEERWEEGEDDDDAAPCRLEMTAASYETMDNIHRDAKEKKPMKFIEDDAKSKTREKWNVPTLANNEAKEDIGSIMRDIDCHSHEIKSDETYATTNNQEVFREPSSISPDQRQYTATTNVQVGEFSITPAHQGGDETNLAIRYQDNVEISSLITEETMSRPRPNFDLNNRSVPLLEATLVHDVSNEPVYIYVNDNSREEEPVYDAFLLSDTQESDAPDWLRKNYRIVISGLVLVTIALIVTVLVMTPDSRNEPSTSPNIPSTNSTTMPGNTVSEKPIPCVINTAFTLFFYQRACGISRHHVSWCTFTHFSPRPPQRPWFGSAKVRRLSEMVKVMFWDGRWLCLKMPQQW
jgi:hypothetical protein